MASYKLRNLFPHSLNDQSGWSNATFSTEHSKYGNGCFLVRGISGLPEVFLYTNDTIYLNNSHKYYVRVEFYQEETSGSVDVYWPEAEPSFLVGATGEVGAWSIASSVNSRTRFSNGSYKLRFDFNNSGFTGKMWFDGALMLDLTEIFGAGKEPTKEWLDENIPWFLGEYTYYDTPEKVLNLNSEKEEGNQIKISWTKTEDDIDFYRIYKDNIIFGEVLDPLPLFEFPFSNESLTSPMLLFSDLNDMFFETDIPIRTEIYFSVTAVRKNKESPKSTIKVYFDRYPRIDSIVLDPNPVERGNIFSVNVKASFFEDFSSELIE